MLFESPRDRLHGAFRPELMRRVVKTARSDL